MDIGLDVEQVFKVDGTSQLKMVQDYKETET